MEERETRGQEIAGGLFCCLGTVKTLWRVFLRAGKTYIIQLSPSSRGCLGDWKLSELVGSEEEAVGSLSHVVSV